MGFRFGQKIIDKIRNKKNKYYEKSYSQDGEDIVLATFFQKKLGSDYKGIYIDLGAHHPERFSNTKYFYNHGWKGINIDATPDSMLIFKKERKGDINLEIGISTKKEEKTYYLFEESALNTFNKELATEYQKSYKLIGTKNILTTTLMEIIEKYIPNQYIDFLSIDVEGLDFEIIKTLDFNKCKPEYILIEVIDSIDKDLIELEKFQIYTFLRQKGYIAVAKTKRTVIFKYKNS